MGDGARLTGAVAATLLAAVLALVPALAWFDAAWNQAQGDDRHVADVVFSVGLGLLPVVGAFAVWRWRRARGAPANSAYLASCLTGAVVGVPVFAARLAASMGF